MSRYAIKLQNCAFFARHGVFREEEVLGQRFYVDVALQLQTTTPLDADRLEDMVDYGNVYKLVEEMVTGTRRLMIETLAADVAKGICNRFPTVQEACVTVRKPGAPIPGILDFVEVTVCWPQ